MKASVELVDSLWESLEPGSPLLTALKELSPESQRAIFLRLWENYTIEEVSEDLQISWDQADALIDRAIVSLRESLSRFFDVSEISEAV